VTAAVCVQTAVRQWCDGTGLRPGCSLSSVAVETPLTSSASSAATTAGCGVGSDVSGCVVDILDDDEPARSSSPPPPPPPPQTTATLPTSRSHTERHAGSNFPTPADELNQPGFRRMASGVNNDCQCPRGSSSLSACDDEDANVEESLQRLQQQKRQQQFRRRQRRAAIGQPSSNSLDELQPSSNSLDELQPSSNSLDELQPSSNSLDELQYRTPPKLVQSSASLTSAAGGDVAAAAYCRKDAWKPTVNDGSCRSTPANSVVVDLQPLQNGNLWHETSAAVATVRTARSTTSPPTDGGLRLPDSWSQESTLHAAKPMTTTWLANRAQTTVGCPPRRARNAWSKSQEIHPKTSGGVCSLRGSASATLISVRRRNSLHAVFVDDSRTALLKDVVITSACFYSLNFSET